MKNLLKIFTLSIVIITSACNRNGGLEIEKQAREFKSFISEEPLDLFSSWDSTGSVFNVTNPSALYALGYCGLYFKRSPEPKEFIAIASKLENLSVFTASLQDTIEYFVPDFKEQSPENRFPTPRLDDPVYNIIDSIDIENSIILGLRQERGNFFTEKGINKAKKFAEPQDYDKIGNGYSNGAIIDYSSKKIIYWIIIW
jgi:hypothetical protein